MATKEDLEILKIIRDVVAYSNARNMQPEEILCGGVKVYYVAIRSIRSVGIWMASLTLLGIIVTVTLGVTGHLTQTWWTIIIYIVGIICVGQISLKFYQFEVPPTAMLVYLFLVVPVSIFGMPSIFALLLIFPVARALIRWTTYKRWFNHMKNDYMKRGMRDYLEYLECQK